MSETSGALRVAEQLRLLVDAVSEYAIFLLDRGGHIQTWNTGARRLKGYTPEEIIGRHFSIFYTQEDIARDHPAEELEIAAREGRYEEEGWRLRKDGSRFWANIVITALRDERGELLGFGKVTRDLTARRLSEEQARSQAAELLQSNRDLAQFQLLVSAIRDYAIFIVDPGGYIRTWNAGAEAIKGYTEPEVAGKHFSIFYTEDDRARNHPAQELEIAARVGRYEEEGWRLRKDGDRFWAGVLITALRNEQGILVGYAKVTRDLTARREAEEELRRTAQELERSNAELERFASAAAHDLVEPLHTIAGLTDLVMRRHAEDLDEDGREALGHVRSGAERLRGLVDGLLAYARASHEALNPGPVAVDAAIDQVLTGLRASLEERGARIERGSEHLGTVLADERLLELVLQNLIANALKFNDREHPLIAITCEPADGHLRLTVADDGIGIAPAHQEQVFALFSRLHGVDSYPGTGMGLALCRRIIERHGGDMGVESEPGRGSRFWFTLPAA